MNPLRKTFSQPLELKEGAEDTGAVTAVIATLEVLDHDGDWTQPGAFWRGDRRQNVGLQPQLRLQRDAPSRRWPHLRGERQGQI